MTSRSRTAVLFSSGLDSAVLAAAESRTCDVYPIYVSCGLAWEREELKAVERLLASPHYGEAWGRLWLDAVRFAETAGFNADPDRPLAYKYRDYVIRSFNDDKSYDQFIAEQIAGDELFPESVDALTATGFDRMWPDESMPS